MKKSLLLLSLAVAAAGLAEARTLSPAEALARANKSPQEVTGTSRAGNVTPVMTVGEAQAPAIYLFNQVGEGYIVLSADDVAAPVLGYSDSGTIDPSNLSPTMRWWLGEYKAQIDAAASQGAGSYTPVSRASRAAIAPLVQTKWDQGSPYNKYCPTYKYGSTTYPTYTGCVATAMAQVMKYHNWPEKAAAGAVFSYEWNNGQSDITLTESFSNYAFGWSDMLNSYSGSVSTTQADAVAKLMQACGYSIGMDYGPYESGAPSIAVSGALVNYFGYDRSVRNEYRDLYTLSEWEDLIYGELQAKRPVVYAGNNSSGGHCFVCDGYQGDGYFHINWGWSGMSDGYFLLNALDPDQQGAGGSTAGYNSGQDAIVNIMPSAGTLGELDRKFVCTGFVSGEIASSKLTIYGNFANYSVSKATGNIAFRITDQDGKELKTVNVYTIGPTSNYVPGAYYPALSCPLLSLSLSNGTYRVYPVFKIGSTVYPYLCPPSQPGYVLLTRNGSTYTVETPAFGKYSVTDLNVGPDLYLKNSFYVSGVAKYTADIEVSMPIYGLLLDQSGNVLGSGEELTQPFSVAGEKFEYFSSWFVDSDGYDISVTPGSYKFAMGYVTGDGYTLLCDPVAVTVNANPGTPKLSVEWNIQNASSVDPDNVVINATVTCLSGYLAGVIDAAFFAPTSQYADASLSSAPLTLKAGESATITIKGALPNATTGDTFEVGLYYGNNLISGSYKTITIGERSGIADVIADGGRKISASPNPAVDYTLITASAEIRNVQLVSLSGTVAGVQSEIDGMTARIDLSALPTGLYLARVTTAEGVETVKIIKK